MSTYMFEQTCQCTYSLMQVDRQVKSIGCATPSTQSILMWWGYGGYNTRWPAHRDQGHRRPAQRLFGEALMAVASDVGSCQGHAQRRGDLRSQARAGVRTMRHCKTAESLLCPYLRKQLMGRLKSQCNENVRQAGRVRRMS